MRKKAHVRILFSPSSSLHPFRLLVSERSACLTRLFLRERIFFVFLSLPLFNRRRFYPFFLSSTLFYLPMCASINLLSKKVKNTWEREKFNRLTPPRSPDLFIWHWKDLPWWKRNVVGSILSFLCGLMRENIPFSDERQRAWFDLYSFGKKAYNLGFICAFKWFVDLFFNSVLLHLFDIQAIRVNTSAQLGDPRPQDLAPLRQGCRRQPPLGGVLQHVHGRFLRQEKLRKGQKH